MNRENGRFSNIVDVRLFFSLKRQGLIKEMGFLLVLPRISLSEEIYVHQIINGPLQDELVNRGLNQKQLRMVTDSLGSVANYRVREIRAMSEEKLVSACGQFEETDKYSPVIIRKLLGTGEKS